MILAYLPVGGNGASEYLLPTIFPEGIETVPRRFAITFRNRWMIAQSDCVVTHVTNHIASGAAQFKALAEKHGKTVIKGEYKKTKLPLAEELISGLMALGKEVSASSVYGLLKAHGISERTANEAKKNLGIDSKKQKDGSWAWLPPKQETEQLSIQD